MDDLIERLEEGLGYNPIAQVICLPREVIEEAVRLLKERND